MVTGFGLRASVVAGLLAMAAAGASGQPAPAPAGNAENGKKLYMTNTCYYCHGTVGQGAGITGARIGPPSRALAGFITYVRRPTGAMPAITEKVLSDRDLTDIYAYLRSIPAKSAKEIPLLSETKKP